MRFVLAITALVLSGIMLVLGIGQVTFLAGPQKVAYSEALDAPNGLAVIASDQFGSETGQANVVVQGPGALIAIGQQRDISAWVAPFEHAQVTSDAKDKRLQLETIAADSEAAEEYATSIEAETDAEIAPPSPFGSDLWLEQRGVNPAVAAETSETDGASASDADQTAESSGVDTVRLPVSLEVEQSVLVSLADPEATAKISIEWVQDRRTPWAGPLLVAGGALALIGALLYLFAVDHDRRGLGPRRGRRGPLQGIRNIFSRGGKAKAAQKREATAPSGVAQTRRRVVVPAIAITAALALSGCTPNYWPDFSAQNSENAAEDEATLAPTGAPVPVTASQISRIVADVSGLAGAADDALDASGLEARFTGDALVERQANYKIRAAVSDYEVVVPRITDNELGYQLVQSTEGWPRTIFVVVASEAEAEAAAETEADTATDESAAAATDAEAGAEADAEDTQAVEESPSLALLMTQQSPHENFLVSRTIALRGGITMPEAAPAEEGTALLADDLQTLRLTPAEVGTNYSDVLAGGPSAAEAENFNLEGDSLIERSGAAWVKQSADAAAAGGSGINYSVAAAQSDAKITSLSTGVGGAFVATTVLETRTEAPAEGSRWRPTVPKSLTALSGLEGQQEKLVSVVAHQLLFFVPAANSDDKIQLLGYTSDLVSASNS